MFSHLYGPLPKQLVGKPAIVNLYGNKKAKAEEWCGAELHEVSKWAKGLTNTIYVANMAPPQIDLRHFAEDEFAPNRGWFPEDMTDELLSWFLGDRAVLMLTVFDGFMGRGTVGQSCIRASCAFVGIDRDPERIQIAREYLGC